MRIFLSYASEDRSVAEKIQLALIADRHHVFFDRAATSPGEEYNRRIREAIDSSDKFIFLISPHSIASGRYTLSELRIAQQRWPHPAGHLLPVMASRTDFEAIPNYLKAVTILEPQGDIAAEVSAQLKKRQNLFVSRLFWMGSIGLLLLVAAISALTIKGTWRAQPELVRMDPERIIHVPRGVTFGYRFSGPEGIDLSPPDYLDHGNVSQLILFEDGKPLRAHSGHSDIEDKGGGLYSHWRDNKNKVYVYFSTTDNSDPRTNNRVYSLNVATRTEPPIKIDPRKIKKVDPPSYSYRYNGRGLQSSPNTQMQPNASRLVILEDGIKLGPAHSPLSDIIRVGRGRYTHIHDGQEWLFFSTSKNSDPRDNGKVYELTVEDR
jgi:hypothetical protein